MFTCIIYSCFQIWQLFLISDEHPYVHVICSSPGEVQQGERGKFLYFVNLYANIILLLEYLILWIVFKIYQNKLCKNIHIFLFKIKIRSPIFVGNIKLSGQMSSWLSTCPQRDSALFFPFLAFFALREVHPHFSLFIIFPSHCQYSILSFSYLKNKNNTSSFKKYMVYLFYN